jgi:hypothetical protein
MGWSQGLDRDKSASTAESQPMTVISLGRHPSANTYSFSS